MKKTSLTRALFVAGVMALAGGMAQADAIFYPDGSHVNLGENAVESGLADQILAQSPSTAPDSSMLASLGVTADQNLIFASDDSSIDTTVLGAGPAMTSSTTTVTSSPVYVFPNINWDRATVLSQPHPMMSRLRGDRFMDRTAAATFDSPTRAGEVSTMTGGAPNMLTDNEHLVGRDTTVIVPSVAETTIVDTTSLGAGPADITLLPPPVIVPESSWMGSGSSHQAMPDPSNCGSSNNCSYLPD